MTIPMSDASQHIVRCLAELNWWATNSPAVFQGLRDAKQGIPGASYDGTPGGSSDPTGRMLNQITGMERDEAARAERNFQHYLSMVVQGIQGMSDAKPYRRLGLPRDHEDRAATKDERKVAESTSIEDETACVSCMRIGRYVPRYRGKLCRWEYDVLQANKDRWPQAESHGMLPIDLVRMHSEADAGRSRLSADDVERSLKLCWGTPRKVTIAG